MSVHIDLFVRRETYLSCESSDPSSTAPHLHAYLLASQPLLALILMIPPLDPSASLRVAYLLRLTGDILDAIPSYPLLGPPPTIDPSLLNTPPPVETTLIKVVDIITQLDRGWSAVLQSQAWDPVAHQGQGSFIATHGPSQTDKTRLVSILIQGRDAIGTWLASGQIPLGVDLQDEFASVFWRSLAQLERDQ